MPPTPLLLENIHKLMQRMPIFVSSPTIAVFDLKYNFLTNYLLDFSVVERKIIFHHTYP